MILLMRFLRKNDLERIVISEENGRYGVSKNSKLMQKVIICVFLLFFGIIIIGFIADKLIVIDVDEKDKSCQVNEDCTSVYAECKSECYGQPVNKLYKEKYGWLRKIKCLFHVNLDWKMYGCLPQREVKCVESKCVSVVIQSLTETREFEALRQHCDVLCTRYVENNFAGPEALAYCEKYFEIDLDRNWKIVGEAEMLEGYGLCEDRVYCFNIKECSWGSSQRSRLTPERCRDIMCDVYSKKYEDNVTAAEYIQQKIEFGSCDMYDEEISFEGGDGKMVSLATWWIDNFQDVHCLRR